MEILNRNLPKKIYWLKKINILFWYYWYVQTRYKIARSFKDLFYSPNGFDLHSIIAVCCLMSIIWGLYDDMNMFYEMIMDTVREIKSTLKEVKELEESIKLRDSGINDNDVDN